MQVDARELQFIKVNAPKNLAGLISDNTGKNRSTINNELTRIKSDYDEEIINEARRLLKVIKGVEFSSATEDSNIIPL